MQLHFGSSERNGHLHSSTQIHTLGGTTANVDEGREDVDTEYGFGKKIPAAGLTVCPTKVLFGIMREEVEREEDIPGRM